jgi:hypothetical protein
MTNAGLAGMAKTYEGKPMIDVPCGPLGPVLQDDFAGPDERIAFFSLDVEGSEPLVLETIDFDKIIIEVVMIETKNNYCEKVCPSRDQIRAKMAELHYKKNTGLVIRLRISMFI